MQTITLVLGLMQVATEGGLASAVANANPGDVIEVAGGTYDVNLVITRDGTTASPITLRPADGQTVVLSAKDPTQRTIDLVSASHWRLRGLKVRGSRHANIRIEGGTDIIISDSEIYDGTKKGIIANGDMVIIRDCVIRDIKQPYGGEDTQGIAAWRASRLRIHHNIIATPGDGILIGGANELTRTSTDVRIYHNHIHTLSSWYGTYNIENAVDVKAAEGVVITDNEIHRYDDLPNMDGGVPLMIQSHDAGAPNLHIDGVRIERNLIYDVGRAISIASVYGPGKNVLFRRNLVYGVTQENMDADKQPGAVFAGQWDGVDIDNNTFVDVEGAAVHGWGSLSRLRVRNNVMRRTGGVNLEAGVSGLVDHTCRYSTPSTGGRHDVAASQRFVNDSGRDYHLAADSPCIDAGEDVGLSYDGPAPDIGRYEHSDVTARLGGIDEGATAAAPPSDGRPVDWASTAGELESELGPPVGEPTLPGDATALLEESGPPAGRDEVDTMLAGMSDPASGGCRVGGRGRGAGLLFALGLACLGAQARLAGARRVNASRRPRPVELRDPAGIRAGTGTAPQSSHEHAAQPPAASVR